MAAEEAQPPTEPLDLWSLAGRMRVLEHTLAATMTLRNSAARARAGGGLVRLASEMMTAEQFAEFEKRLAELENEEAP
jgi:Zn-dependent M32 family carboxypeptidase